jgi:hypothetical protein
MQEHFKRFLAEIRPTENQLSEAKKELDFIEKHLPEHINEDDPIKFLKALRSGSYAKNTMLRRHQEGDFDADIGLYFEVSDAQRSNLLDYTEQLLRRAYRNRTKRIPTFKRIAKSSVKVSFEENPKINIDAVPIISKPHKYIPNWGAIPRRDGELRDTSVTEHITFVQERNKHAAAINFNKIVMLVKWWRNHTFEESMQKKLSSFGIELILGKAFDECKEELNGNWFQDLLTLGNWIVRNRFSEAIWFPHPHLSKPDLRDEVVLVDPLNPKNNIARDWTSSDKQKLLSEFQTFCDVVYDAKLEADSGNKEDALEFLDQIFAKFSTWSMEE